MKDKLPINIEILKWARLSRGLSIEDVADKVRIKGAIQKLSDWESGKSSPSYSQLEKLAYNIYKRPLALFFFPEIPKEDNPQTEFRSLPDKVLETLPPEIIDMYRKAKVYQYNLDELFEGEMPFQPNLLKSLSLVGKRQYAGIVYEIRDRLMISTDDQYSWGSFDKAFKNWRNALENSGVFVFKDAFKNDNYSGFCIYDVDYPIIYINNSTSKSRQIFTLFHELGHLLFRVGGINFRKNALPTLPNQFNRYEVACNKFANEFLVPPDVFDKMDLTVSERNIEILSRKFSVSREVILRNFLDRNLVDYNFYEKLTVKWNKNKSKSGSGGNPYLSKKAYLGDTYSKLVFEQYYRSKISLEHLSDYLGVKPDNISTYEYYVFK